MEEEPLVPETLPQNPRVQQDVRANAEECRPLPAPPLSRKLLWITLGVPPVLILIAMVLIPFLGHLPQIMFEAMIITVFLILFGIIPGLSFHFYDAVRIRYRGQSLAFLVISYILSQIIVCAIISVGSCVIIAIQYKI